MKGVTDFSSQDALADFREKLDAYKLSGTTTNKEYLDAARGILDTLGVNRADINAYNALDTNRPLSPEILGPSFGEAVRRMGQAAVDGFGAVGNAIFQAMTLGTGPKLGSVLATLPSPGATMVLGGGNKTPVILGKTSKTGMPVGVNFPGAGVIAGGLEAIRQGEGLRGIASEVVKGTGGIAGAVQSGALNVAKDTPTTRKTGVDVTLGTPENAVKTDTTKPVLADAPSVKVAGKSDLKDAPSVKVAGKSDLKDAPSVKVAGELDLASAPEVKVDSVEDIIYGPASRPFVSDFNENSPGQKAAKVAVSSGGGGGGGGGGVGLPQQSGARTVSGGPGETVDIDYLFNFAEGLDQPFLTMDEQEILENLNIYAKGGPVKKFFPGGQILSGLSSLSPTQKGLLGAAVGGIFGGMGGSGDTQGSQGYAGGIPALTASRDVVPNAFAMGDRRPGEAGRRYFSDVQYNPITDVTGAPTIMGGAELATMNQTALDRQKELSDLGLGLMETYEQKLVSDEAAAKTAFDAENTRIGNLAAAEQANRLAIANVYGSANTQTAQIQADAQAAARKAAQPAGAGAVDVGTPTPTPTPTFATTPTPAPAPTPTPTTTPVNAVDALFAYDNIAVDQDYNPTEINTVASAITDGLKGIADVAQDFGVGETDVWGALLRQEFYTPETLTTYIQQSDPDYTEVDLVVRLLQDGQTTAEEVAAYYQSQYPGITAEDVKANFTDLGGTTQLAQGGNVNGYYLGGSTDGMADNVPATIDNSQPAALSDGEFVIPADVVSHLGNGNSDAGAQNLYGMMDRIRTARTGNPEQGRQIDPNKYLA
tara:strand:- start:1308 stop:3770 length:2463 start_codon:yes stop_codon:yes gene_type:complete